MTSQEADRLIDEYFAMKWNEVNVYFMGRKIDMKNVTYTIVMGGV